MIRKAHCNRLYQLFAGSACLLALAALVVAGTASPLVAQSLADKEKQTFPAAADAPQTPKEKAEGFKLGAYEGHAGFEIGARVASDVRGNNNVYRSMVNLGEGFRLFNADFSLRGSGKMFDHLDLNLNGWGGEPYNTARFSMGKTDKYELSLDYRRHEYFFYIPVYANPLLQSGSPYGQHSTDMGLQTTDVQLKFLPNSKIRPFFAYAHNSGINSDVTPSFTTYSVTGKEFMLFKKWNFSSDEYRGGVEFAFSKLFLSLQQGWRLVKNDEGVSGVANSRGNSTTPYLGQTITMTGLNRGYHDRVTLPISQGVIKFTPFQNLKISGRYVYSMSTLESNTSEIAQGNLLSLENALVYGAASDSFNTRAKEPNHLGSFIIEYSPWKRITLMDRFETRSQHTTGSGLLNTTLFNARTLGSNLPTANQTISDLAGTLLTYDRITNEADLEFDVGHGLVIHGGHIFTTADTTLWDLSAVSPTYTSASRKGFVTGFYYNRGQWLHLGLDYEKNLGNGVLTRTSLNDYDRFRIDWRLGSWHNLSVNGKLAFLRNSNAQSDLDWKNHNRDYSVAINYAPSQRFYLSLDYSRYSIWSDLFTVLPATFQQARSLFDERSQGLGMMAGVDLYKGTKVEFGYRGVLNVGSLPLQYHQPFAGISIPLPGHLAYKTTWWWHGYNEKANSLEDFRRHMVTFSLAFSY
jgi:hypothetical protein